MKKNIHHKTGFKLQRGIALLEAMIGLVIFSLGILAIVGLQGVMIKASDDSKSRATASFLAHNKIAVLWGANPDGLDNLEEVDEPVSELPNGLRTTTITSNSDGADVQVTIRWQVPGEAQHVYQANAVIAGAK